MASFLWISSSWANRAVTDAYTPCGLAQCTRNAGSYVGSGHLQLFALVLHSAALLLPQLFPAASTPVQ